MKLALRIGVCLLIFALGVLVRTVPALSQSSVAGSGSTPRDGQHDFDFEIGTWKTHLTRLVHPSDWLDCLGDARRNYRRTKSLGWPRKFGGA